MLLSWIPDTFLKLAIIVIIVNGIAIGDHHKYKGDSIIIRLIQIANTSSDKELKIEALHRLGHLGDKRAIEVLVKSTYDKDWNIRKQAIITLKYIDDVQVRKRLLELTKDIDPKNVIVATETLYLSSNDGDLSIIANYLTSDDSEIRMLAAQSFWFVPANEFLPNIKAALEKESNSSIVKKLNSIILLMEDD